MDRSRSGLSLANDQGRHDVHELDGSEFVDQPIRKTGRVGVFVWARLGTGGNGVRDASENHLPLLGGEGLKISIEPFEEIDDGVRLGRLAAPRDRRTDGGNPLGQAGIPCHGPAQGRRHRRRALRSVAGRKRRSIHDGLEEAFLKRPLVQGVPCGTRPPSTVSQSAARRRVQDGLGDGAAIPQPPGSLAEPTASASRPVLKPSHSRAQA
jgi:hypothetical protein